ncbi:MAG TPA: hypothetical protein PKW21_00055 [Rhabdaerophilum sp.]|nr:hypothetical protein [Rhabdaerophilum sp.]
MKYITLGAVTGILALHLAGAIPSSSVGGPLVIALVCFTAAIAVGVHEAWTERRGVMGWILNLVVSFAATFFAAQLGGMILVLALTPFTDGSSLAATGGGVMATALAGTMGATIFGVWGTLRTIKQWR